MKLFFITLLICNFALASSISGIVKANGKIPTGTLYIFAKKFDGSMPMPLAVLKIDKPKYPVKFELNESNKMMKSIPFKGPFKVVARISPSGSATDKTGIEVTTTEEVKLGDQKVELLLKVKK